MPNGYFLLLVLYYITICLEIQNLGGHLNSITGSRVRLILLNGGILPIGGSSAVDRLQSTWLPCLVYLIYCCTSINIAVNFVYPVHMSTLQLLAHRHFLYSGFARAFLLNLAKRAAFLCFKLDMLARHIQCSVIMKHIGLQILCVGQFKDIFSVYCFLTL